MLPLVTNEAMVNLFKYWSDGMRDGMRHDNRLYGCHRVYQSCQRLQAYNLACCLSEQGCDVCLTVSAQGYKVWVDLRSPKLPDTFLTAALPTAGLLPQVLDCPSLQSLELLDVG